ncbi:MAG TPA: DUF4381 domain-containing protein [Xanthobacteraceae bacterium]|nr:DUF4381 domain-containing protein [Xanthobacteraceae bacterium]
MAEAAPPSDPLAGLIDIPLPPPVSLLPQTWPSRIAIVLVVAGLIAGLWWFVRWWRANRYRRAALAELAAIERMYSSPSAVIPGEPLERRDPGSKYPGISQTDTAGVHGSRLSRPAALGRDDSQEATSALALLVRRTALAAFPRQEVASLAGPAWLAFLDRSYGGHEFSQGSGQVLSLSPYEPQRAGGADLRPLIDLVRRWIRTHHD